MTKIVHILFEDDLLLVIDKPSGMTVNRSDTTATEQTVQDWLEGYLHIKRPTTIPLNHDGFRDAFIERSGIVHRLDKETSGVLLIAKTNKAFLDLQTQFKERRVKKKYVTLVHGKVIPESGEIRLPVGRQEWNRKRFGVVAGGREAVTFYSVISFRVSSYDSEILSLLSVEPQTGRTHQIRVHLKYINHPVFSDILYAGRKQARTDRKYLDRVFLHAQRLIFIHPSSRKEITIESALREELTDYLETFTKPLS